MSIKKIIGLLLSLIIILTTLFLNGNLQFLSKEIPPIGKLLDPINGLWAYNDDHDEFVIKILNKTGRYVEVKYDENHVPHLYSKNLNDLLYAQGFLEAKDRLFQMQFIKAAAAGELSEWFGERTLEIDLQRRKSGLGLAAERTARVIENSPEEKDYYQSYVNGVNAYIQSMDPKDYPFEFKLFNKKPKKWDILSSAYIYKYMANILAGGNDDIEMTNLRTLLGNDLFHQLYPEREKNDTPVIPMDELYEFDTIYGDLSQNDSTYQDIIYKAKSLKRPVGVGSNNWAVSGNKTLSKKPILCNDPHLSLTLPSVWYSSNLISDNFNAYGVSFPGLPGLMIGFNENIAWGETNVGQDVEDLFLIKWANKERTKYYLDDEVKDVEIREELIKINGKEDLREIVKYTYWGPVVHESENGDQDLAKRWLVLDNPLPGEAGTFVNGMQCKDYDCYNQATAIFGTPAQNFLFASKDGDIALRVNGKLPVRHNEDGRYVQIGDKSASDWQSFIPRSQNPQILNPNQNYIFSSNQYSTTADYPYYYKGNFERYRNRIIDSILRTENAFTIEKMMQMQQDVYSLKAEDFVELFLENVNYSVLDKKGKGYYNDLKNWDKKYKYNYISPTLFEYLLRQVIIETWDEISEYRDTMSIIYPQNYVLLDLIKNDPENQFFDIRATLKKENASDIINAAFSKMVKFGLKKEEENKLQWGKYRNATIPHLTRIPALGVHNLALNGSEDVINAINYSFGPSWRMIISLEDKTKAFGIYPGGQSGDPRSKYYKNMLQDWIEGKYQKLKLATYKNGKIVL